MPPPSSRMTKNQAQPARYRPGKAEIQDQSSDDESSEGEEEEAQDDAPKGGAPPKASSFPSQKKLAVDLSKAGQQTSAASKAPTTKKDDDLDGFVTASESEDGEEEGSDDEQEESSEEEESSSDDEPKKPMLRPTFISKAKRAQLGSEASKTADDQFAEDERKRKEKADELLQAQLEKDAAARAMGKKAWDDDADIAPEDEVDDTDDLDPEAERAAWKLRELKRVRRDRMAIEEKEKEREEIERRRNLTAEEREAEDKEYIAAQNEEREGKGKMSFMQKYHHKGAFFQGAEDEQDEEVKAALNRDFAGARFEDDTGDKSVLPEYMRIRDMTKLGKKGRTRYTDMKNEDTGRWGEFGGRKRRENDDVDDRFKPDDRRDGGSDRTGANSAPVGERRRREDDDRGDREDKRMKYD